MSAHHKLSGIYPESRPVNLSLANSSAQGISHWLIDDGKLHQQTAEEEASQSYEHVWYDACVNYDSCGCSIAEMRVRDHANEH